MFNFVNCSIEKYYENHRNYTNSNVYDKIIGPRFIPGIYSLLDFYIYKYVTSHRD